MLTRYRSQIITAFCIFLFVFFGKQIAHIYESKTPPPTPQICNGINASPNCMIASGTGLGESQTNILGTTLELCSKDPMTGFERDGYCKTGPQDPANHSVCAVMTTGFLQYTLSQGNDLITPGANFPGLKAGDRRCLCASRRYDAYISGIKTEIVTGATNKTTLQDVPASFFEGTK